MRAGEMAWCAKALASSKTDVLSQEPSQSRERASSHRLSSSLHKHLWHVCSESFSAHQPAHNVETY